MRNDLKDEPTTIPSLTIDKDDCIEEDQWDLAHDKTRDGTSLLHTSSKRFWRYLLGFLFILYSIAMVGLFLICKQTTDHIQYQLDEKTTSNSLLTQSTNGQLQKISNSINKQQEIVRENLENLRTQNKEFASKLINLAEMQQKIIAQQDLYDKQLNQLQNKLIEVSKLTSNDKTKQLEELANEMASIKKTQISAETIKTLLDDVQTMKKQNLPQSLKSIQDDVLLLRSQLDNSSNQSLEALQTNIKHQLADMQTKLQNMQQQLDNRSPY